MVPSSASISGPNVVLNTIVAEALDEIATRLEGTPRKDINKVCQEIVRNTVKKHGRVIFNGNNYSADWVKEARKRGIPNISSTIEAMKSMANDSAVKLFGKYGVLSKQELHSRYDIYVEGYVKTVNIEALCAVSMTKRLFIPAAIKFTEQLADTILSLKEVGVSTTVQEALLKAVTGHLEGASKKLAALESKLKKAQGTEGLSAQAEAYRDQVRPGQVQLRKEVDALEELLPDELWPVPTYADMLFKV